MGPRHRNSAKSEGVVRGFSAGSASHDAKEPHSDSVERLGNMFSFTSHRHQQLMKSEETIMIKVKINGQNEAGMATRISRYSGLSGMKSD